MKLSEVCEFIADCPHSTAPDEGKGFPLIRTPNVGRGRLLLDNVQRVSKVVYDKRNMRAVPRDNDLIFAREAPAGNVAIIKYGEKVCLGQRTVLLRPDINLVDPDFLTYYLLSPVPQNRLLGGANGSTVNHVNLPIIRNLPIDIPLLPTQQKIGRILSAYDDLIENHRRQIRLLEEGAERLYKEWFVKFHYPGANVIYSKENLPVGWKFNKIKDVCKQISSGGTPSRKMQSYWSDGNIKWYKTGELQDTWLINSSEHITASGLEHSTAKLFPKNSIAMAIYASPTLGRLGILSSEAACNQAMLFFIVNDELVTFEWLFFKLFELRDNFNSIAKGAGQQNISADLVKNTIICVPPIGLIRKFTYICRPFFEECLSLELQISKLQEARDRLLPKLMSGEVKV